LKPNNIKILKNIIKYALLEDMPSGDTTTDAIPYEINNDKRY
jgi:nicotinate-nucleotide pyrophosphorylase